MRLKKHEPRTKRQESRIKSFLFLAIVILSFSCKKEQYTYNEGKVYGTFYHIVYDSPKGQDFHAEIDEQLKKYNAIFSTYDVNSTISKVNRNKATALEPEFTECFERAMQVSRITAGAFDITAGNLVTAWGFGAEERKKMTKEKVDSLLQTTGYKKIRIENGKIIKYNPNVTIDMSAIAKGYTCDLIAEFLQEKGCLNYMVEIGGEIVAKGKNEKGKTWTIGINKPDDDSFFSAPEFEAKVKLPNHALATSGNYRNYYIENGVKYAHTIDPKTGYPVQHEILSATVLAKDCMTADAFATAFMVMGLQKSIEIANAQTDIEVFFIYNNQNDSIAHYVSNGFKQYIVE